MSINKAKQAAWTALSRASWMEVHLTAILKSGDPASVEPITASCNSLSEELSRLRHHAACLQQNIRDAVELAEMKGKLSGMNFCIRSLVIPGAGLKMSFERDQLANRVADLEKQMALASATPPETFNG